MKEKIFSRVLTVIFLAMVFLPHIVWPFVKDQMIIASSEKRTLAEKPALSIDGLESYPQEYEAYYNDHLPFRDHLIRTYNLLQYKVLKKSPVSKVLLGEDGWLFYNSIDDGDSLGCYNGSLLLSDEQLERIADNLTRARDGLQEQGIEFILFIAPNKERMYSEYMPLYMKDPNERCMINQVVSYLRKNTDLRVVYAYDELTAYKKAHPDNLLYYKTDTHWNDLGGYIGARALLAELGIDVPMPEQMGMSKHEKTPGDLADMMGLAEYIDEVDYFKIYNEANATRLVKNEEGDRILQYENEGVEEYRIFFRNDSFYYAMNEYLNPYFSDNLIVHRMNYEPEIMLEYQPDVFVLETVERYVPQLWRSLL